jgi:hypothetical protein
MKFNKWTLGLAAVGVVSLTSAARADESKPSALETALSNTTISGYVSASANVGLTKDYYNSPAASIPFQSGKENGFNLDVVKLVISKPEDATPWASGYEADLLFGPDAYNGGAGYNQTAGSSATDFAIKQAFVTLNAPVGNGLDFKVGVFDSPLGYEVFDSGSNPNYTRSYGYAVEPTELTGVDATYKFCDALTVQGGVADTSSAFINNRAAEPGQTPDDTAWHEAYFGDVTLTAPSSWGWAAGSTAFAGVLYGSVDTAASPGYDTTATDTGNFQGGNQINYYGGLTLNTPWKQFTAGVAFDFVQNAGGGDNGYDPAFNYSYNDHNNEWVVGAYGTYKATDKLSFSGRGEFAELDYMGNDSYYGGYSGNADLVELTGTVEYDLWANVMTRVEARWDQNLSGANNSVTSSSERASVGLYANVIYKF